MTDKKDLQNNSASTEPEALEASAQEKSSAETSALDARESESTSTETQEPIAQTETTETEAETAASSPEENPKKAAQQHDAQQHDAQHHHSKQHQQKTRSSVVGLLVGLNLILILGVIAALVFGYVSISPKWNQLETTVEQASEQVQSSDLALTQLNQADTQLNQKLQALTASDKNQQATLDKHFQELQLRLDSHNQRLLALSNTSREDWQLAEAHYLVRLANQRLLVDRSARSAIGLMEAADQILRELALPDLFAVREALARDLAALKLANEIDREGIYLRLQGLAEALDQLPTFQKPELHGQDIDLLAGEDAAAEETQTWWQMTKGWFVSAGRWFGEVSRPYLQIQHHNEPVGPLLPPSSVGYLRQNLRFSLEQAQLALLREETAIYQAALSQAENIVTEYFPESSPAKSLLTEIAELKLQTVEQNLPTIFTSQQQLQAYLDQFHRLNSEEDLSKDGEQQ
ncbi:uroporphyrinogen-III C-methyltransferase [Sessilibacter sp. MAH4]